jgi:hypothetical protein
MHQDAVAAFEQIACVLVGECSTSQRDTGLQDNRIQHEGLTFNEVEEILNLWKLRGHTAGG